MYRFSSLPLNLLQRINFPLFDLKILDCSSSPLFPSAHWFLRSFRRTPGARVVLVSRNRQILPSSSPSPIRSISSTRAMEMDRSVSSSMLILDGVGEVDLIVDNDGISWKLADESHATSCLGKMTSLKNEIKFVEIYAVEFIGWGFIEDFVRDAGLFHSWNISEMYRFVVHGYHRKQNCNSPWVLCAYTFGHKDFQTCQTWAERLQARINKEAGRPKNLRIFVHPLCGKGNGLKIWETVAPLFARARVKTTVHVTTRAGHAYDMLTSFTNRELCSLDGIVTVGGDGLFNEVLNGLLSSRYNFSYPPAPAEFSSAGKSGDAHQPCRNGSSHGRDSIDDLNGRLSEPSHDHEPLLPTSESSGVKIPIVKTEHRSQDTDSTEIEKDDSFAFPNDWFRLGLIPAGSTDAIVICTTGVRDPVTSALHIILGEKVPLDIAQVVRWKASPSSTELPTVRYAASFAGYGFYGDVIKESEKYRWMGPKRYDFAGTKVFLEHRSYEAEIAFLEDKTVDPVTVEDTCEDRKWPSLIFRKKSNKVICQMNCIICKGTPKSNIITNRSTNSSNDVEGPTWLRSKGHFLSVGAAVISCRNERAPDGLVADAHLADGFLHLILIKDCPRSSYLWHLTQLTRRGGEPLKFKFVEHHKTRAFTFVSNHDKSAWNLDGELFQACQVSVQVCQGLVNLFASGPEV